MIDIKLKEILRSKNKTMSWLHEKTGISKNTLSVMANNASKGIQFDTLEKICRHLEITPNDLIEIKSNNFMLTNNGRYKKDGIDLFTLRVTPYEYVFFDSINISDDETVESPNKTTDDFDISVFAYVYTKDDEYKIILFSPTEAEIKEYDSSLHYDEKENDKNLNALSHHQIVELTINISEFLINFLFKSEQEYNFVDVRTRFDKNSDFNLYTYREIKIVDGKKKLYPVETTLYL